MNLSKHEHQQLVLMCGSKAAWQTYLGLADAEARSLWKTMGLLSPTEWVRMQSQGVLVDTVVWKGSIKVAAKWMGVSESFLKNLVGPQVKERQESVQSWTEDEALSLFERYRTVRFVARMKNLTETEVRRRVEALGLELTDIATYDEGGNSTNKGRRAELEFARMRGDCIVQDMNVTDGPTAKFDFLDSKLGRVNVKSSRQWRYKAKTRRSAPDFWKVSTAGVANADHLVLMCYDREMKHLVGWVIIPTREVPTTFSMTVLKEKLTNQWPTP